MDEAIRQPIVAGAFYPGTRDDLSAALSVLLGAELDRPTSRLPGPFGLIAPHAGYLYSGSTAAAGYRAVAAVGRPDIAVLLGANHTGFGDALSLDDHAAWRTPLGELPVARDVVEALRDSGLSVDRTAFVREHSIEVQLPFLQFLWGNAVPIVPICVQPAPHDRLAEAGSRIADALADHQSPLIVASSDFTHYESDETARALDRRALDPILALDGSRFLSLCIEERLSICGAGAISALIAASRKLGLTDAKLIDYSTSGDTTGDRAAVVGYAAVSLFRREDG